MPNLARSSQAWIIKPALRPMGAFITSDSNVHCSLPMSPSMGGAFDSSMMQVVSKSAHIASGRRLRVLLFAYACEPDKGSEPGIGWNIASRLAAHHEVWVLTRRSNMPAIEEEVHRHPVKGLHFVFHDLPRWMTFWKSGNRGVHLYSYVWQLTAASLGKKLHASIKFDAAHHLTLGKYWAPAGAAFVGLPYLWGPVGGGDGIPKGFWHGLSRRSRVEEALRIGAQRLAECDPLTLKTARRATLALGTTEATNQRLRSLGAASVRQLQAVALDEREVIGLRTGLPDEKKGRIDFISLGRLVGWKGHHLALRALAKLEVPNCHYTLIGAGPELARLKRLSQRLGISDRVHFPGSLPRHQALQFLARSDVFIQPSLHDSGGSVTLEAMACAVPVIALRLGGPAYQVTAETAIVVEPTSEAAAVEALRDAMHSLAIDPSLRQRLGVAGQERVRHQLTWDSLAKTIANALETIVNESSTRSRLSS